MMGQRSSRFPPFEQLGPVSCRTGAIQYCPHKRCRPNPPLLLSPFLRVLFLDISSALFVTQQILTPKLDNGVVRTPEAHCAKSAPEFSYDLPARTLSTSFPRWFALRPSNLVFRHWLSSLDPVLRWLSLNTVLSLRLSSPSSTYRIRVPHRPSFIYLHVSISNLFCSIERASFIRIH